METSTLDTPMLRQYKAIKTHHMDAILFFRLGDFYEMFLDDAKVASKELELTLTGRGKSENRIPMCGIPYHAADNYISKLIQKGFKVAICEQVEDPALCKGLTTREVIKVITPGTVLGPGLIDEKENNYLLAINLTPKNTYGISYVDITTGEFRIHICTHYSELIACLDRINPKELLTPQDSDLKLSNSLLCNSYDPISSQSAAEQLNDYFQVHALSSFGIDSYSQAYPSAWAILQYLKQTQKHQLAQITRLLPTQTEKHLTMDKVTIRNLELTDPLTDISKKSTLFWVLDHTKTAMGARKLKTLLKNPYANPEDINPQLDAVDSLKSDLLSREEIREILHRVSDLERLVSRIVSEQNNPKDLIALKESLSVLKPLHSILTHLTGDILKEICAYFSNYDTPESPFIKVITLIENSITDDPPALIKDGHFIKEGFSEELDQLNLSFKTIRAWIATLEPKERERTQIKTLKVGFNKVFGYYFEISKGSIDKAPADYIRKQTLTNAERYITPELKEKENILLNGEEKQKSLEISLYQQIVSQFKTFVPNLQELAEKITHLDLIQSLATAAQKNNYTRPQFADPSQLKLEIQNGRHPILEKNAQVHFIPNPLTMDHQNSRFMLITGPNMAGKSTLMRQIALITVMAHIGSFVPAESAILSPVDQIFTRIGALDNLYFGQSTFMVEMLETANILHNASANSLIILDEIGRGTSTFDGMSIASAISEYIYETIQARTLFATHYHELTVLANKYPAFENYSMKITEQDSTIVFNYILKQGPANKSYGIHVAKMAGIPDAIIQKATQTLTGFETHGIHFLNSSHKKVQQLSLF